VSSSLFSSLSIPRSSPASTNHNCCSFFKQFLEPFPAVDEAAEQHVRDADQLLLYPEPDTPSDASATSVPPPALLLPVTAADVATLPLPQVVAVAVAVSNSNNNNAKTGSSRNGGRRGPASSKAAAAGAAPGSPSLGVARTTCTKKRAPPPPPMDRSRRPNAGQRKTPLDLLSLMAPVAATRTVEVVEGDYYRQCQVRGRRLYATRRYTSVL
jgi:hypothetical protein